MMGYGAEFSKGRGEKEKSQREGRLWPWVTTAQAVVSELN